MKIDDIKTLAENKIWAWDEVIPKIEAWKQEGAKVVFTNGCFDLLHTGHLSYLLKAASFGDKLVIGLNADASVRQLKGPSRPINAEYNRALMLSALFFVDAVIVFEEETPLNLINLVKPDILVKGGDYTIENIVGAREVQENGGEVRIVDFLNGFSSTLLINKISGKES